MTTTEMLRIADSYYYGDESHQVNEAEAFNWYMKAAKLNNAEAQYRVGYCYFYGTGVAENNLEALKWFCYAAEQGFITYWANIPAYGAIAGTPKEDPVSKIRLILCLEANEWLREHMTEGNPQVITIPESKLSPVQMLRIGAVYYQGFPSYRLQPNKAEAAAWFQKSCNSGLTVSEKLIKILGLESKSLDTINSYEENTKIGSDTVKSSMDKLNNLVGLQSIKSEVLALISLAKMQKMRQQQGLRTIPMSNHLVFTGNPGTGKTTVARILAELYKENGILKTGQLVEVDRADLVAGYVGQTAIKTQEKIEEAIGGILFIDEAYTLAKQGNDFGQESIDTILKAMEDRRNEFVVIVAGYQQPMESFINSNPGLRSRFNKYIHFPDYSYNELVEIFLRICRSYDYSLTEEAFAAVKEKLLVIYNNRDGTFANARTVRNLFEQIITRQALRLSCSNSANGNSITTTTSADI